LETGLSVNLVEEREAAVDALCPGARRNLGGAGEGKRGPFPANEAFFCLALPQPFSVPIIIADPSSSHRGS
jgi:hypothetical protein